MVESEKPPIDKGKGQEGRQFDSLVDLPACTCEGSPKLKEHAQLLRLMQFFMGLDDVFKCFELVGYPSRFKKGNVNQNNVNNVHVDDNKSDHSNASNSHASIAGASQHINFYATFLYDIINVTHLNLIVARPNGTLEQVKQIRNYKHGNNLIVKDVLVVPAYKVNLLSVHKFSKDNKVDVSFTEYVCKIQDLTQKFLTGNGSEKEENGITELTIFDSNLESNEAYDGGGDCADIGNEFAPNKSTNEPRVNTIDSAARNKDNT
ncbi:hypothetical protein Tco_0453855 [Tanacetum coccineum]